MTERGPINEETANRAAEIITNAVTSNDFKTFVKSSFGIELNEVAMPICIVRKDPMSKEYPYYISVNMGEKLYDDLKYPIVHSIIEMWLARKVKEEIGGKFSNEDHFFTKYTDCDFSGKGIIFFH